MPFSFLTQEQIRKDKTPGDFVRSNSAGNAMDHIKIEIGSPSKHPKKADFVIRDDTDYP